MIMLSCAALAAPAAAASGSMHAFSFTSIDGAPLPMSGFAGQAVLVVNTASFCGFTRQYGALQQVYETYRDRGLVVLGVPSNDFGGQEPGTEAEIKQFCEVNFAVDFPLTEKQVVRGDGGAPVLPRGGRRARRRAPRRAGTSTSSWSRRTAGWPAPGPRGSSPMRRS